MNLLLIALGAIVAAIQAQPQRPTASIEGIVIGRGTGEALGNARVQLNMGVSPEQGPATVILPRDQFHRTARSDGNGRFLIENVAAGVYRLIATYEGEFVPA